MIEQAKRMKTDEHSAETDREGTAARLLDTIPSILLSGSCINEHFRPSAIKDLLMSHEKRYVTSRV